MNHTIMRVSIREKKSLRRKPPTREPPTHSTAHTLFLLVWCVAVCVCVRSVQTKTKHTTAKRSISLCCVKMPPPHHRRTGSAENLLTPAGEATTSADTADGITNTEAPSALSPALSDILSRTVTEEDGIIEDLEAVQLSPHRQDVPQPQPPVPPVPAVAVPSEASGEHTGKATVASMPRWCTHCAAPVCVVLLLALGVMLSIGEPLDALPPPPPPFR